MERRSQRKQHPAVDVTGDGNKVRCCKEQYCMGTCNVRSMNQGKLEVVGDNAPENIPVVDVTGDGSKVRCCKEQYCIGT